MADVLRVDGEAGAGTEGAPPLRLAFALPPRLVLSARPGRFHPCLHRCLLTVADGRVRIEGPDRRTIFEQARRFLRLVGRGHGEQVIEAVLVTPPGRFSHDSPGGRDSYTIVLGADVVIAPARAAQIDIGVDIGTAG